MFKTRKTKKVIVSSLLVLMLLSTAAFAANEVFDKKLTATHGRIKLSYEGKDVTKEMESKYGTPAFTVKEYGNRAYVPVRALADLLGVSITYDETTHTANFVDNEKFALEKQLELNEEKIAELELEIKKLKNQVVEETKKEEAAKTDIKELERKLNKDYDVVDNVGFSVSLKESSNKITASITIDTKDSSVRSAWRKMTIRSRESIIEDIVADINKVFTNYKVDGSIYDDYERYTVYEFSTNSSGKVIITDRDYDLDDILDDAEYYLKSYLNDISTVESVSVRENSYGDIYGTVKLKDEGASNKPTRSSLESKLYDAERKIGSNSYLDIDVYYGTEHLGRYYDGRLSYK